jgi:hypothetical protein
MVIKKWNRDLGLERNKTERGSRRENRKKKKRSWALAAYAYNPS